MFHKIKNILNSDFLSIFPVITVNFSKFKRAYIYLVAMALLTEFAFSFTIMILSILNCWYVVSNVQLNGRIEFFVVFKFFTKHSLNSFVDQLLYLPKSHFLFDQLQPRDSSINFFDHITLLVSCFRQLVKFQIYNNIIFVSGFFIQGLTSQFNNQNIISFRVDHHAFLSVLENVSNDAISKSDNSKLIIVNLSRRFIFLLEQVFEISDSCIILKCEIEHGHS